MNTRYTAKQIQYMFSLKDRGLSWPEIAQHMQGRWRFQSFKANNLRVLYQNQQKVEMSAKEKKKKFADHPHVNFVREAFDDARVEKNLTRGKFIITAAGAAAKVHEKSLDAIETFCEAEKAKLVIMPMRAHVRALEEQPLHYDPILLDRKLKKNMITNYQFNEHIRAVEMQINPQQINPLTGIHRVKGDRVSVHYSQDPKIGKSFANVINESRKTSIIVAHSKQMLKFLPTGITSLPRMIHSTGCITVPNYQENRIGLIAEEDHDIGGLILEIEGDKFFLRQFQCAPDGSFVDLGTRYHASGDVTEERAEALVIGDLHAGNHDQTALSTWYAVYETVKPKKVFWHDVFDGQSISHHLEKRRLTRAQREPVFQSLEDELQENERVLIEVQKNMPKSEHFIVHSNHHDHLTMWLEDGRYLNDKTPGNYYLGHKMVVETLEGKNPLKLRIDPKDKFKWIGDTEDFFVEGIQCAAHGHQAANGARGTATRNDADLGNAMVGHSHTPGIMHQCYTVGTTSKYRMGYNRGASTWVHCSGLIYKGGGRQLVVSLDGAWFGC